MLLCNPSQRYTNVYNEIDAATHSNFSPSAQPGNFNNCFLVDAGIPYDMKLKNKFPITVDVSADLRKQLRAKFPQLFPTQ